MTAVTLHWPWEAFSSLSFFCSFPVLAVRCYLLARSLARQSLIIESFSPFIAFRSAFLPMRMFDSYEHQQPSSVSSACEMESMDEIPPPSASSILSLNDDLTMSTRLSTTAPQSSVTLRFKVRVFFLSFFTLPSFVASLRRNANANLNQIQFLSDRSKISLVIIFNARNVSRYRVSRRYPNCSVPCVIAWSTCFKRPNNPHRLISSISSITQAIQRWAFAANRHRSPVPMACPRPTLWRSFVRHGQKRATERNSNRRWQRPKSNDRMFSTNYSLKNSRWLKT